MDNNISSYTTPNDIIKPTIVTAFFDIGRGTWQGFSNGHPLPHYLKRTTEEYFQRFERLLKLENDIVVFTSNDLVPKFDKYKTIKKNLFVIGFEDWRKEIWPEFFPKITKVMNDPKFQHVLKQPWNPECWSEDYVMVNMLKAYFVNYAIDFGFVINDLVAWIDFGYCREPTDVPFSFWVASNFDPEKIHMFTLRPHMPASMDIRECIIHNDVIITGCHIVAGKKRWYDLMGLVYQNLTKVLDHDLIDDDQGILAMSYFTQPELFQIHHIDPSDWFCIFRKFNHA